MGPLLRPKVGLALALRPNSGPPLTLTCLLPLGETFSLPRAAQCRLPSLLAIRPAMHSRLTSGQLGTLHIAGGLSPLRLAIIL